MKTLLIMLLAIISGNSFAETQAEPSRADAPLDIAKTISITDTSNACGIVPVELVYDDSNGQRHTFKYQVWGDGCNGG